jgi:hypothetical protein
VLIAGTLLVDVDQAITTARSIEALACGIEGKIVDALANSGPHSQRSHAESRFQQRRPKVYDGTAYSLLKSIPLKVDADSIGYRPRICSTSFHDYQILRHRVDLRLCC